MFTTYSRNTQIDDLLSRICIELQISPSKHAEAESRYNAVSDWLGAEGSPLAIYQPRIHSQGSLRIGTTVQPIRHNEFDLDLVFQLNVPWERVRNPIALLDIVEKRLKEPGSRYSSLVTRKNRCIRLDYANEFHMDILPACPNSTGPDGAVMVPDRKAQAWKPSNPSGYATWFENKAAGLRLFAEKAAEPLPEHETAEEKKPLKLAVQLLKRWRDIHYQNAPDLAPISIVLTTLAANHYKGAVSVKDAIGTILDGILSTIPLSGRLVVLNPTNAKEDFSERWDDDRRMYPAFVEGIKSFRRRWEEIDRRQGIHNIGQVLEQLFGEKIYKTAQEAQAQAFKAAQDAGRIGFQRKTGAIGLLGSMFPQAVPRNTFYGD